jgi:hypothetical protein
MQFPQGAVRGELVTITVQCLIEGRRQGLSWSPDERSGQATAEARVRRSGFVLSAVEGTMVKTVDTSPLRGRCKKNNKNPHMIRMGIVSSLVRNTVKNQLIDMMVVGVALFPPLCASVVTEHKKNENGPSSWQQGYARHGRWGWSRSRRTYSYIRSSHFSQRVFFHSVTVSNLIRV